MKFNLKFNEVQSELSGVPQSSVLSAILFLFHENDIDEHVYASVWKSADDTKLLRRLNSKHNPLDVGSLQQDLESLEHYVRLLQMELNVNKFVSIRFGLEQPVSQLPHQ